MARILQEMALLRQWLRSGEKVLCRYSYRVALLVRAATVTVLGMIVLVAAVVAQWWLFHGRYPAQFPEIFPAPCVKSANSTSRFSDT